MSGKRSVATKLNQGTEVGNFIMINCFEKVPEQKSSSAL